MTMVCGIDEAGLGPVLGPLVMTATAFAVPDDAAETCLWKQLSPVVTRNRPRSSKRVRVHVADSKKVFTRQSASGLTPLESGVLTLLAAGGTECRTLAELLAAVAPRAAEMGRQYPWYNGCELPLPFRAGATGVALAANAVKVQFARRGVCPEPVACEVVFAEEFNRLIEATQNKSATAFGITARLLRGLWDRLADPRLLIWVDRQGGRTHYLHELSPLFPECELKILDETPDHSAYRLNGCGREAEVHFCVAAEDRQLPVALASMVSKYLRELFMEQLNAFWASHVPDLAPTAGYATDGRRFYEQIAAKRAELGIAEQWLWRCR